MYIITYSFLTHHHISKAIDLCGVSWNLNLVLQKNILLAKAFHAASTPMPLEEPLWCQGSHVPPTEPVYPVYLPFFPPVQETESRLLSCVFYLPVSTVTPCCPSLTGSHPGKDPNKQRASKLSLSSTHEKLSQWYPDLEKVKEKEGGSQLHISPFRGTIQ